MCMSMKKFISARVEARAGPRNTMKPEPLILAPRVRSRMPSASPISQCGRRRRSRAASPHVRTIVLRSSPPSGTSGERDVRDAEQDVAQLGLGRARARASSRWISSPSCPRAARSGRRRLRRPSCAARLPATSALRAAFRSSTAWMIARRSTFERRRRDRSPAPASSSFCRRRIAIAQLARPGRGTPAGRAWAMRRRAWTWQLSFGTPGRNDRNPQFGSYVMRNDDRPGDRVDRLDLELGVDQLRRLDTGRRRSAARPRAPSPTPRTSVES